MSPDLKTFVALQTSSVTNYSNETVPMNDEAEAIREHFAGVGEVNYMNEEDVRGYSFDGFGVTIDTGFPDDVSR